MTRNEHDDLKNYEAKWLHKRVEVIEGVRAGHQGHVSWCRMRRIEGKMVILARVTLDLGPLWSGTTDQLELVEGTA